MYNIYKFYFAVGDRSVRVEMAAGFPYDNKVEITVTVDRLVDMKLRVRVPSWAAGPIAISVNGRELVRGNPGTYAVLDRVWQDGDVVSFTLPMKVKVTQYQGLNNHVATSFIGFDQYVLEYGPLLLAVLFPVPKSSYSEVNPATASAFSVYVEDYAIIRHDPAKVREWLAPDPSRPLHFTIKGHPEYRVKPTSNWPTTSSLLVFR